MPDDYAEVRDMVIYCARMDDRMEKLATKTFWKRVGKKNLPHIPESGDEKLSRMQATLREAFAHGHEDMTVISQDQDALIAYIESFGTHPPIFIASLEITLRRMKSWAEKDLLKVSNIPCLTMDQPCHVAANKKFKKRD